MKFSLLINVKMPIFMSRTDTTLKSLKQEILLSYQHFNFYEQ